MQWEIARVRPCAVKIDKDNYKIIEDEFVEDISVEDLAENLPETACR